MASVMMASSSVILSRLCQESPSYVHAASFADGASDLRLCDEKGRLFAKLPALHLAAIRLIPCSLFLMTSFLNCVLVL